jgi:hypothetical protein
MLKKLSYKQQLKLLPVAFIISLLLIYWIAIHGTIAIRHDCKELTEQSKVAVNAPGQVEIIRNKLDEINQIAGGNQFQATDPLLEFISNSGYSGVTSLVDYQPVHIFNHENYRVETRIAVFEGSFTSLLKFLYHLEKEFKSGKIISVKFQTEINFKTNRKRLLMTIYIQSLRNETIISDKA